MADEAAVCESSDDCTNNENEAANNEIKTAQTGETETLSKRQRKRLLKNQQWEETRELRKQKRKERKQQRKLDRQAQTDEGVEWTAKKRLRQSAEPSSLRLVIDCSFDGLMVLKICVSRQEEAVNHRVYTPMLKAFKPQTKRVNPSVPLYSSSKEVEEMGKKTRQKEKIWGSIRHTG
ncbi:hypothetical protein DNTS_025481, partial [Danionella cerebrum]